MYIAVAVLRVNLTSTQGTKSHERGSVDVSNCDDANMRVKAFSDYARRARRQIMKGVSSCGVYLPVMSVSRIV